MTRASHGPPLVSDTSNKKLVRLFKHPPGHCGHGTGEKKFVIKFGAHGKTGAQTLFLIKLERGVWTKRINVLYSNR
jgi:hypothetical protein